VSFNLAATSGQLRSAASRCSSVKRRFATFGCSAVDVNTNKNMAGLGALLPAQLFYEFLTADDDCFMDDCEYGAVSNPPIVITVAAALSNCREETNDVGFVENYHEETIPSYSPDVFASHFRMSRGALEVSKNIHLNACFLS
jgi:hypothetical protein